MSTPESSLPSQQSSTSLAPNVAGALAYVLGPITGIAFFILEKKNQFVRFHAAQSIVVSVIMIAVSIVLSIFSAVLAVIPILGWLVALLLSLGLALISFGLWLVLMFMAFSGKQWEVPVAGQFARKLMASGTSVSTV
jgi:uncharacterized membrane protein